MLVNCVGITAKCGKNLRLDTKITQKFYKIILLTHIFESNLEY